MTALLDEAGNPRYKVMIAVPTRDSVKTGFARSLALLMAYTTFVRPGMEVFLYFVQGTFLPRARAGLVQAALDRTCTHVLWLDSDMVFPKDTLLRLLGHGVPIVAANYAMRQAPILPTALDTDRQPIFASEGLVDVRACGMGVMLTGIEVFRDIGKPWFALGYNRALDDYSSEDTYFCERARVAGYRIRVDGPLSEEIGHLGEFAYEMAHARMTLEAARGIDQQD